MHLDKKRNGIRARAREVPEIKKKRKKKGRSREGKAEMQQ